MVTGLYFDVFFWFSECSVSVECITNSQCGRKFQEPLSYCLNINSEISSVEGDLKIRHASRIQVHVTYLGNVPRRRKREEQGQRREGSQAAVQPANEAPAWCSQELLPWSEKSRAFLFLKFSVMDWEWGGNSQTSSILCVASKAASSSPDSIPQKITQGAAFWKQKKI